MELFIVYALAAGSILAIAAAPLGSIMLFRRLAYFGDAMGHTAILGIALGVILGLDLNIATFAIVVAASLIFYVLYEKKAAESDTLLGIIAQTGLSLGIVTLGVFNTSSARLMAYLFGDILTVGLKDLIYIAVASAVILMLLAFLWKRLLIICFDAGTSLAENGKQRTVELLFLLVMSLFVALAIKTTGILLVTALLIIPAAAVRRFGKSPEQMAVFAAVFGLAGVWGGFALSYFFDLPTGPAIVICLSVIGIFISLLKKR